MRVFLFDLVSMVPYYVGCLCSALRQKGAEVTLGSSAYYLDPDHWKRLGLRPQPGLIDWVSRRPIRSAPIRRTLKFLETLVNLAALWVRFTWRRPDILHIQFLPLYEKGIDLEWRLARWAQRRGSRLVYTVHDSLPHDSGRRHEERYRRLYRGCDALICHTEESRQRLIDAFGVDASKLWVIPHGPLFADIPTIPREEARRRAGLPANRPLVLWQGIIKPYKGVSYLLDAWRLVRQEMPSALLVVAGTGETALLRGIEEQAARLGIQDGVRLDFHFLTVEQLTSYYDAADLVVYPYREITTSGALMTGLARRKAIVATDLSAFRHLLTHGTTALLVRYGQPPDLAEAILELLRDDPRRTALGQAAYAQLDKGTNWLTIAGMTLQCYRGESMRP
jgi:glycosyltransferase involved in cell wall biosynthesis